MSSPNLGSLSRQHLATSRAEEAPAFDFWPRILHQGQPEFDQCTPSNSPRWSRSGPSCSICTFGLLEVETGKVAKKTKQNKTTSPTKKKQRRSRCFAGQSGFTLVKKVARYWFAASGSLQINRVLISEENKSCNVFLFCFFLTTIICHF